MKLRKTWIGICVWVIYLVGMIFAIGVTGFVSGLFPAYDRYIVAGGALAVCLIAAYIIGKIASFIGNKVNENESVKEWKKPAWLEILVPMAIAVIAFFTFNRFSLLVNDFSGNIELYDSAVVAISGEGTSGLGFADAAYVGVLRIIMSFLGNSLSIVSSVNLFLRILMVLFLYIAIRASLGMVPAIACAGAAAGIPSFGYSLLNVDSKQLVITAVAMETMLVVLYVRGFETTVGTRMFYKIFSILIGALIGFMFYIEAASAIVIVFLLAAWELADMCGETFNICLNEILLLLSGVAAFIGALIYVGGPNSIQDTYYHWTWKFYGYNDNSWLLMIRDSLPNTYFALAILTFAFVPSVLYFAKDRAEKITPWLMFSVLMVVASVFLGDTVANTEVMIITAFVILISCGATCFAYVEGEEYVEEIDDDEEEKEEEENEPEVEVVKEEKNEVSEQKEDKPRFVPEGMVLPMGDEDEEDLIPNFNMNRPEMAEIVMLSVGNKVDVSSSEKKDKKEEILNTKEDRKSEKPENADKPEKSEVTEEKKDDFDITLKPGDDFDI